MGVVRFVDIIDCEYLDRFGDVFQFLQTEGSETESKLSADLIINGPRYRDAAGLADALEPRRDVDPLAQYIVAVDQHVAEMDADAIDDSPRLRRIDVALDHHVLDRNRAFDGGDHGGNSSNTPSPMVLTTRPPRPATI